MKTPLWPKLVLPAKIAIFILSSAFSMFFAAPGRAQTDSCVSNLPTPAPNPPAHRVVQLVNCSNATLLGAANAAGKVGQPLTSVFPRSHVPGSSIHNEADLSTRRLHLCLWLCRSENEGKVPFYAASLRPLYRGHDGPGWMHRGRYYA